MLAQPLAQSCVKQMRRRMIGPDRIAPRGIDIELDQIAGLDRAASNHRLMRVQPPQRLGGVAHLQPQSVRAADRSRIAHLAAALTIKRGLVGQHHDVVAGASGHNLAAIFDQCEHLRFGGVGRVTGEFGRADALGDIEPHLAVSGLAAALPRRAGSCLLLGHRRIEPGTVHRDPARTQRILGQIVGKAERVIEFERGFAGQLGACAQLAGGFLKQLESIGERAAKLHFLARQGLLDQGLRAAQFGIGLPHLGHQSRHQPVHQRILRAEQMRVAHCAAHDPAQHITASLAGRQHPVSQQEADRAQVIGDHPVAGPVLARCRNPGQAFRRRDQRTKGIGLIVVVLALQHRRQPFQPHAGIDAGLGQFGAAAIGGLLKLHEHQVPDLDKPVAVLVG